MNTSKEGLVSFEELDSGNVLHDRMDEDHNHEENREGKHRHNVVLRSFLTGRSWLINKTQQHSGRIIFIFLIFLLILYHVYFIYMLILAVPKAGSWNWCDDQGFVVILTLLVYFIVSYYSIKKIWGNKIYTTVLSPVYHRLTTAWKHRAVKASIYLLLVAAIVVFLAVDAAVNLERLRSLLGLFTILFIGLVFSISPEHIRWRIVFWGLGLQFVFGLLILRLPLGNDTFMCLGHKIEAAIDFTNVGSTFVYGQDLVENKIFYFQMLPVIIFFCSLISILYYLGYIQVMIQKLGWLLFVTMGTTACESMNSAANVFIGMIESPLMIKPFLPLMTKSELHAVMTGGMATMGGGVLAAFISFGIPATHLLTASVMSAPAALVCSKLFYPETETSKTNFQDITIVKGPEVNVLEAAAKGALLAIEIILSITAQVIAFLAGIAFLNSIIGWVFAMIEIEGITFQYLVGWMFAPMAWLMGVPSGECLIVGELIGVKSILNEFIAYTKLADLISKNRLSKRSINLATYALCGFSNFASIGILVAALTTMAPERKSDMATVAFRSYIAANAACLLTACVAGTLLSDSQAT